MYAAIVVLHVQEHILGLEIHYMLMFETENTVTPDCSRILSTSVAKRGSYYNTLIDKGNYLIALVLHSFSLLSLLSHAVWCVATQMRPIMET